MKRKLLLLLFCCSLFAAIISAKTIRYVKVDGTGDGSSWVNASNSIQTMIDNSTSGDEVWVAKGTYYPTTETIARDSRSKTFLVKSGVNLYGGFSGSESAITQRSLADLNSDGKIDSYELVNSTVLCGDIDGVIDIWSKIVNINGSWKWTISGNENNSYSVVTCSGSNSIDGFSITGGNANNSTNNSGGGINASSLYCNITNCIIYNCSASFNGGGIYGASSILSCYIYNCFANNGGGGIYWILAVSNRITGSYLTDCSAGFGGGVCGEDGSILTNNCIIKNCSAFSSYGGGMYIFSYSTGSPSANMCKIDGCSALKYGGGIYYKAQFNNAYGSFYYLYNSTISNCSSDSLGGGIYLYPRNYSYVVNCTINNCTSDKGGGIYSIYQNNIVNCSVINCNANSDGGGIRANSTSAKISNCYVYNNFSKSLVSNIISGTQTGNVSQDIISSYVKPTSFVGIVKNETQKQEIITSNWRLKSTSLCINAGTSVSTSIISDKDLDNNTRIQYGTVDIGAFEYVVPTVSMPISEKFDNITTWDNSSLFYNLASIKDNNSILWSIVNQKADFTWQTNLTTTYSEPIFTYQIDGTKSSKVYLRYDMFFQAYAGTISPLGTEKLNVEYSTDLVTWSTIATYSNANGTIANQTYKYDLSTKLAGKKFFIRFNANGANSNRIEKWEIDNVLIDADGLSAVNDVQQDKYKYSVNNGVLNISNLGQTTTIQLFDTNGKILANETESKSANFILPIRGVYIVKVASDAGVENKKIVW